MKKKIAFVGKFDRLHDEEYIALSLEALGHDVIRIPQDQPGGFIHRKIFLSRPEILLFTKWEYPREVAPLIKRAKEEWGMKTVCWLFDLYWGYKHREFRLKTASYFRADIVATTDGGHDEDWKKLGINHFCVRQGIYDNECFGVMGKPEDSVIFVGSENPYFPERTDAMDFLKLVFDFHWYGRRNTNEIRGRRLNDLFSQHKIVVGDSVYSPHYWSNRVVETLGRGGFLIHQEVPGLKEAFPHLVTYKRGNLGDLREKIEYYFKHEGERLEIIERNLAWVRFNYTAIKQCEKLLALL